MMSEVHVKYFDTTLRDGTQGENISFSAEDKIRIARKLDSLGIHYIEGGWPGSNPKDMEFFERAKDEHYKNARIVAFGSTMRFGNTPQSDPNIQALISAQTPAVSIFGKTWTLHIEQALGITCDQNLALIHDSVHYLKSQGREVIYDAEHFFDGYKDNPDYAINTLLTARLAGADWIVLCDTNGGTLPHDIQTIVQDVIQKVDAPIGIHAHNDAEMAVANSITAVQFGCRQVQGTINGYGERCGNANLCSIIPNLQIKLGFDGIKTQNLSQLTTISLYVSELANLSHNNQLPYVGKSAFAHKGGIHVSAVIKNPVTYEHIEPQLIGNVRRVLLSDLSGQSNIRFKAEELNLNLDEYHHVIPEIVKTLKQKEHEGYMYEAAEASLELLIKKITQDTVDAFEFKGFRMLIEKNENEIIRSEATIRVNVNGISEHTAAESVGPVHALDQALRKALMKFFPEIDEMQLSDYKVRVLNEKDATKARVRVLIDSTCNGETWGTVGVSENIIEASWQALMESFSYYLINHYKHQPIVQESA
jgi:2-isopropylmalate synthase